MTDIAKLKASELLLLNATEISNQLRHLADNEIDSDSFAVVSESYNGREVEFERPITDLAIDAAGVIDGLIAALEAAEKTSEARREALDRTHKMYQRERERAEAAEKRIAELEIDEVRQRLANAEHQLHMAELAKHNLRAGRKAQFRKRKAAEKRIAELEARTVKLPLLNDDLVAILGRPCFTCAHLAELMRKSGDDIRRKAEHEQAAVIYWFLGLYLEHGDKWEAVAKAEIQSRVAAAGINLETGGE